LTVIGLPNGSGIWQVFVLPAGTISNKKGCLSFDKIEAGNYGATVDGFSPLLNVKVGGPDPYWTGSGIRTVFICEGPGYRHIGPR
jgi:hypothetical protein